MISLIEFSKVHRFFRYTHLYIHYTESVIKKSHKTNLGSAKEKVQFNRFDTNRHIGNTLFSRIEYAPLKCCHLSRANNGSHVNLISISKAPARSDSGTHKNGEWWMNETRLIKAFWPRHQSERHFFDSGRKTLCVCVCVFFSRSLFFCEFFFSFVSSATLLSSVCAVSDDWYRPLFSTFQKLVCANKCFDDTISDGNLYENELWSWKTPVNIYLRT